MPTSSSWLVRLGVVVVAVAGATASGRAAPPSQPQDQAARTAYARQQWEQGQAAMRVGQVQEAIRFYEQSLAADPTLVRNHLSLAAAYLEAGDTEQACAHLAGYLHFYPDHVVVRSHFAELLMKLERLGEARE